MNHEKNLKVSFLVPPPPVIPGGVAKNTGKGAAEQFSPPKSWGSLCTFSALLPNAIVSLLSESGHFLVFSRVNRDGTCALRNTCAGGLPLWRIVFLELPHGRPTLEAGPNSVLLHRVQNLGLGTLSRADFWEELAHSGTRAQRGLTSDRDPDSESGG